MCPETREILPYSHRSVYGGGFHFQTLNNNKMKFQYLFLALMAGATFTACTKENTPEPEPQPELKGNAEIKFDHVWGPTQGAWSVGQTLRHPSTGDTITFDFLNYYITNVKLTKADGSEWIQPNSYHLVKLNAGALATLTLNDIPEGDYTSITYTIGVDSARNVSGAQEGALAPSQGMFWSWNTGYIFVKAEGRSPQAANGTFKYHLGGLSGANNAIRTTTLNFGGGSLRVRNNALPSVHLYVNVARFWHGGILLSSMSNVHMPGANASTLATNFRDAFSFDHLHN